MDIEKESVGRVVELEHEVRMLRYALAVAREDKMVRRAQVIVSIFVAVGTLGGVLVGLLAK